MKKVLPLRLKIVCENIGWTQEQVSLKLNISIGTLSGYERGYRSPNPEMLARLASLYDTSTDYLLGRTDNPNPPKNKREKPNFEDYVLSASGLGEATIRIAELDSEYGMDDQTFTRLSRLAYNKYGLPAAKGSPKAAGGILIPGTGALDEE